MLLRIRLRIASGRHRLIIVNDAVHVSKKIRLMILDKNPPNLSA
jgi:hypothetical protein